MENQNELELVWEELLEGGVLVGRLGRSKSNGAVVIECRMDASGREVGKSFFDDEGHLEKRIIYEYDNERRPKLTTVYDESGKLIWRQPRGERPETFG